MTEEHPLDFIKRLPPEQQRVAVGVITRFADILDMCDSDDYRLGVRAGLRFALGCIAPNPVNDSSGPAT